MIASIKILGTRWRWHLRGGKDLWTFSILERFVNFVGNFSCTSQTPTCINYLGTIPGRERNLKFADPCWHSAHRPAPPLPPIHPSSPHPLPNPSPHDPHPLTPSPPNHPQDASIGCVSGAEQCWCEMQRLKKHLKKLGIGILTMNFGKWEVYSLYVELRASIVWLVNESWHCWGWFHKLLITP